MSLPAAGTPLAKTSGRELSGQQNAQVKTALQRGLDKLGVTAEFMAERLRENVLAERALTYMGKVTGSVPDYGTRIKAAEQILRIRGEYAQAESALAAVAVEISIDERRAIQVKAAARLGAWGQAYQETDEQIGVDVYPAAED